MEAPPNDDCGLPAPPATARPMVLLHVKPESGTGPTRWSVGFDEDPAPGHKAEVYLPQGSGAHEIHFQLVGSGPAVRFDLRDPIWVREGRECPDAPSLHEQIQVLERESSNRKLVIVDKNKGDACLLSYQLNFIGAGPCDPMIRNGGEL